MSYKNFRSGQRCSFCSKERVCRKLASSQKFSVNKVKHIIESLKKLESYKLISSEYKGIHSQLEILHEDCGRTFKATLNDFQKKSNKGCPHCTTERRKLSSGEVEEFVRASTNGSYRVASSYSGVHDKMDFIHHLDAGKSHRFSMRFNDFRNGQRCPICFKITGSSAQINVVEEALRSHGLHFEKEKTLFEGRRLRSDFFIGELNTSIEFDGIQHFGQKGNLNNIFFVEEIIQRDWEKNFLHQKMGISILRIPYTFRNTTILQVIAGLVTYDLNVISMTKAFFFDHRSGRTINEVEYYQHINPDYIGRFLERISRADELINV